MISNASAVPVGEMKIICRQTDLAEAFAEGNLYFLCLSANYCQGKIVLTTFILIFG